MPCSSQSETGACCEKSYFYTQHTVILLVVEACSAIVFKEKLIPLNIYGLIRMPFQLD